MCDRQEARTVLWGRHQVELLHAQNLGAEAEKLETGANGSRTMPPARRIHQASCRDDKTAERGNRMIWSRVKAFCLNSLTIA
jgi:hypothetical protein